MLNPIRDSSQKISIRSVKSVSFKYTASEELSALFEDFRLMCNDAIRIAVKEQPKNRFALVGLAYPSLKGYGLHTHYILSACEIGYSVCRNKKRKKVPYVSKAFLKLDNQSYSLNHLLLRIPVAPKRFIFLTLQGSDYHLSFVDDQSLKRGSVTITERTVSIAFTKETPMIEPRGHVGLDINERNATVSGTDGYECKFMELAEVAEIKERYREIRAKIGRATKGDRRITKRLYARYGRQEKNRSTQRVHKITKEIVNHAEESHLGIKMERLKGKRKLYRRGNGQGTSFRGRMNTWVFGEVQRQIQYKAAWLGVPVYYVNPRGTSSYCPDCGSRVAPLPERKLYCPKCDKTWDRDDLASKNIMACAVPQDRPPRGSSEGERGGDGSNPPSRWAEVGLRSRTEGGQQNLGLEFA